MDRTMKGFLFFSIIGVILLSGCTGPLEQDELIFKGIPRATVPTECVDVKDDTCGLFACMVDRCWCDDSPEAVFMERDSIIMNEFDAKSQVVLTLGLKVDSIRNVVKLNDVFYNVFLEDDFGKEVVYTVAVDGTVFEVLCGV